MQAEWFASWFDSPHYHRLYAHRNVAEAAGFIDALVDRLRPRAGARMLDLGCGAGRHAIHLAEELKSQPRVPGGAMDRRRIHQPKDCFEQVAAGEGQIFQLSAQPLECFLPLDFCGQPHTTPRQCLRIACFNGFSDKRFSMQFARPVALL